MKNIMKTLFAAIPTVPTAPRLISHKEKTQLLESHDWQQIASVTSGGKPYFWYRRDTNCQYWLVWNRRFKQWQLETAPRSTEAL